VFIRTKRAFGDETNNEAARTETRRLADNSAAQNSGGIERVRPGYDEAREAPAKQAFGGTIER
jgi:hypothetical protein